MIERLTAFLKESYLELKRVSWPTRAQTLNYTLVVILTSVILAAFLGGLDALFSYLLNTFIL